MKIILSFSLLLFYYHFTVASIQKLNNPILPILLGDTKIISSKHTFVSYINVSELFELKNSLKLQVTLIIKDKNNSSMSNELAKQAWSLLYQVEHLLEAIHPNIRKRRGLINIGGTINKWLFGTLDHEDGERINSILNHLNKNDKLITEKINEQMSIAKDLMTKTNHSLFEIKSNIISITQLIEKYQEKINIINALNLIINSLISLENNLNQIINAMTFAYLNKIHPTLLPLNNLKSIIEKMSLLYQKNQLISFKNQLSFYKLLGVQLVSDKERIIFLIHFPIISPLPFKSHFIYPIPIQNQIISPPKPYLILNEKTEKFQYEEELCEKIEDTFYCKNHLEENEDCVVNIVKKNNAANCSTLLVHMDSPTANQVTPQNVLFTTPTTAYVTEICQVEKHNKVQPGSYLIFIPDKCHINIGTETFYSNEESLLSARIVQLPPLDISLLKQHVTSLKLKTMNLEEIKHITSVMNDQNKLILPEEEQTYHYSWLWVTIGVCAIICIVTCTGIRFYYKISYPYPIIKLFQKREKPAERPTQPTPSQVLS